MEITFVHCRLDFFVLNINNFPCNLNVLLQTLNVTFEQVYLFIYLFFIYFNFIRLKVPLVEETSFNQKLARF